MRLRIARLKQGGSGLAVAWLSIAWSSIVLAQSAPPPVPSPNPGPESAAPATAAPAVASTSAMSVEERIQKLEQMNQQLLDQNQQLTRQLKSINDKIDTKKPPGGPTAGAGGSESDPDGLSTQPTTGSAVGGGELMARPTGPAAGGGGGGVGANVLRVEPSTSTAFGGGELVSTGEDVRGVPMKARFGRRFVNNGLWFESENKNFQVHIGGRTQLDASWYAAGNSVQYGAGGIGKLRDGVDARRWRFRMEGLMYEQMLYVMEVDFANTGFFNGQNLITNNRNGTPTGPLTGTTNTPATMIPAPQDVWIGFRRIPIIGNLRIGNQKEPFGFERLVSSRFLNFMERSFNNDAFYSQFTNGFVPGVQIFNTAFDRRMTWAAGIFRNVTNAWDFAVGGGGWAETARLTGLLLYEDEGKEVMHLGITGRTTGYDNGTDRIRIRGPERSGLASVWANYADTGNFRGSGGIQDINLESVNVFGPWTIDAEYDFHFANNSFISPHQPSVGTWFVSGGYVEILYFLTGEHRTYIRESGLFDRIVPRKNAYWVKGQDDKPNEFGHGAWQVGIRYNYLNLNDKGINGGVLQDITLGLNWFINPNCKFQWNYSITDRHSPASPTTGPGGQSDGTIQGFGMRYAMDY